MARERKTTTEKIRLILSMGSDDGMILLTENEKGKAEHYEVPFDSSTFDDIVFIDEGQSEVKLEVYYTREPLHDRTSRTRRVRRTIIKKIRLRRDLLVSFQQSK